MQAVRPGTAECCPQTTQRPTAARAARRRLAASLSRLAVSGWQSAQRRRPGAGGALPHSMQVERSARRRCCSERARWAWRRAARQSSQLVLPSAGALRPHRRQRPAWRRLSRNCCLRARLASRSLPRQASQRRGPGVGIEQPQSRHSPRLRMRSRRFRSDFRELARRRSMLSGEQLGAFSELHAWPRQPQVAVSAGRFVSGGAEAGMQGMGAVSCWRGRTREPVGRPPAGHAPTTLPPPSFRRTGQALPFAGNRRRRRPAGRARGPRTAPARIGGKKSGRRQPGPGRSGYLQTPWVA